MLQQDNEMLICFSGAFQDMSSITSSLYCSKNPASAPFLRCIHDTLNAFPLENAIFCEYNNPHSNHPNLVFYIFYPFTPPAQAPSDKLLLNIRKTTTTTQQLILSILQSNRIIWFLKQSKETRFNRDCF